MLVIKVEKYSRLKALNQNLYGRSIIGFAERWAEGMEKRMDEGCTIKNIYTSSANVANKLSLTPKMQLAAYEILEKYWVYGQNLKSAVKDDDKYKKRKERS